MWLIIRFCTWISDVTLVTSQVMQVSLAITHFCSNCRRCFSMPMIVIHSDRPPSTKKLCRSMAKTSTANTLWCWLQRELAAHKCQAERIEVWQRGVDTIRFHPSYRSDSMRSRLSDGHPEAPLLVHVGRLGAGAFQHSSTIKHLDTAMHNMLCSVCSACIHCAQKPYAAVILHWPCSCNDQKVILALQFSELLYVVDWLQSHLCLQKRT